MKVFSSSPYATFNPKEWNALSRTNHKFSNTPIKIEKKYFGPFKNTKSIKIEQKNNDKDMQIQLAFAY